MKLFIGLGNPGPKYAMNRHNIGFMAVDNIALKHKFTPWRKKFQGYICDGILGKEKVILLKPDTFMNLSGQSVAQTSTFYKLQTPDMTVFHDELDLPAGKCRLKYGGGHAGHNGLRSIQQHLSADFHRVRLGIGRPERKEQVAHYVLQDFAKSEQGWLDPLLDSISVASPYLTEQNDSKFMNAVTQKKQPTNKNAHAAQKNKPANVPNSEPDDNRTALQKLIDKFN